MATPSAPARPVAAEAPGRFRALAAITAADVLALRPWFSASAVLSALRQEWHLGSSAAAGLTIAVQLGFSTLVSGRGDAAYLGLNSSAAIFAVIAVGAVGCVAGGLASDAWGRTVVTMRGEGRLGTPIRSGPGARGSSG